MFCVNTLLHQQLKSTYKPAESSFKFTLTPSRTLSQSQGQNKVAAASELSA